MAFARRARFEWMLRTRSLALGERTLVMAIVNLTPDSFSGDGVAGDGVGAGVDRALRLVDEGADIVDMGAESTRPGATPISAEEEQRRLLPVLREVVRMRPGAVVSVDTYHASTAMAAAEAGAEIVNDVSGMLWDERMAEAVRETGCGLVLMHTRGRSQEWKAQPRLAMEDVTPLVLEGLRERMRAATEAGICAEKIVVDPGFGFGKIGLENVALLAEFATLQELGRPLLAGVSRKGFLGELVRGVQRDGLPVTEARRNATMAAHVAAILQGAHVVRVHDLQEAKEAAAVGDAVLAVRGSLSVVSLD